MPDKYTEEHQAMAHMFIVNPLAGQKGDNLFSTHPATQNRINALMTLKGGSGVADFEADNGAVSPWVAARQNRKKGPWG